MSTRTNLSSRVEYGELTLETIDGERFWSPPVTPYLETVIRGVAESLRGALAGASIDAEVHIETPLVIDERTTLIPDARVVIEGQAPPGALVAEVRTESTDRYALGPKRMIYSRVMIPEYWFVDPIPHTLSVMRFDEETNQFSWPPNRYQPGVTVTSTAIPGLEVEVGHLFPEHR